MILCFSTAFLQIAIVITVTGDDWVPEAESSAESVAREFVVVFPWNNGDPQYAPTVSLNLINPNDQEASVDLSYTTVAGLFGTATLRVDPFGITTHIFEENVANYCEGTTSLISCPDTRIFVKSDVPISVIANDHFEYTPTAGDSFTVVPISMAGDTYSFALPAPHNDYSTIYFIPISDSVNIQCSIWTPENNISLTVKTSITDHKLMAYRSSSELTVYANGDGLFMIIAAVRSLVEMDFGVIMPTPIPRKKYVENETENYYPTGFHSAANFYLVPSNPNAAASTATLSTFNGTRTVVKVQVRSTLVFLNGENIGWNGTFYSKNELLNVVRYGGYQLPPDNLFSGYGYLDMVPSWSQFVTGATVFNVPTINSYILIIGDEEAAHKTFFDDRQDVLKWWQSSSRGKDLAVFSFACIRNPDEGLHTIWSSGRYTIFIAGVNPDVPFAYAFTPTFNGQLVRGN